MNDHEKNIIISHVYSRANKGDAALTSVLIEDLRRKFGQPRITILTLDASEAGNEFEGVKVEPSFMCLALDKHKNPAQKLLVSSYMMAATLLWAARFRRTGKRAWLPARFRKIAEIYAAADLIVPVGGGYIRSRPGIVNRANVPLLLHPLLFGYILGKPTVLYPQSVGPFQSRLEEKLTAFVLQRMSLIMLREDTSAKLLKRLGVRKNVVRAVDSGFLLHSDAKVDIRKRYHLPTDKLIIGVTVRSWLNGAAQTNYERAVATALDNFVEYADAHVLFVPQVTASQGDDDRISSRRVHSYMRRAQAATVIEDEPDHRQIKAIYDKLDLLLGTRFHSVIFSLTSFVPVVAVEYEHKTSGIMHDLGLDDWVIKIEDATAPRLTELLLDLAREQDTYRERLRQTIPTYQKKAQEAAGYLEVL